LHKLFSLLIFITICSNVFSRPVNKNYSNDIHSKNFTLAPDEPIWFTIAVNQKNSEYLRQLLMQVSDPTNSHYGHYLTTNEIRHIVTDYEANEKVSDWINNVGLNCTNYGDSFQCFSNSSQVGKLFNVIMYKSAKYGWTPRSYIDYITPAQIAPFIRFIDGLSNMPLEKKKPVTSKVNKTSNIDNGLFTREVAIRLYNITHTTVSNNSLFSSGGVIEFQEGGYVPEYIEIFEEYNDLPSNFPCINIGKNKGNDPETTLDIQMMSTIAANVCLGYYSYPVWLYSAFADLAVMQNVSNVLSVSYGWPIEFQCQISYCFPNQNQKYVYNVDTEFVKLGLRGVSILVASGDSGGPGGNQVCQTANNNMRLYAEYPTVSPYVTSVGATALELSEQTFEPKTTICKEYGCANGTAQRSINFDQVQWTTGGGFNIYSNRTNDSIWQEEFVDEYLNSGVYLPEYPNLWNIAGRAAPDIVSVGHSCATYGLAGTNIYPLDGTSCSSPSTAAMIVLLNDKLNRTLGFLNPLLYQSYGHGVFDYVHGSNIFCTEMTCCNKDFGFSTNQVNATRYDPVRGLGSINFGRLLEYLENIL
jgi:tripeptidyl-peptidase-1